ncbi:hypothetical protein BZA77DRAFT_305901 [Pyronema omphalodes]|nr:hypothetical protein BZA77DRAFT_305901 [Pyronema omphalodes]
MEITRFTFFLPQFVLAMLSYLAGYYTPPRLRFIYVALQAAMFFSVLYYVPSSTAGNDYQWATACFFLMMKSGDFFLLSSPYDDFYLNGQPKYAELSFWGRIYWAFNLSFSGRYSGTSYQVAYLPPGPSPNSSRIQFLKQSINLLCLHAFCSYFFLGDPYLMTRGVEGTRPRDLPFHQRAFYCWLNCLNAIFGISFPNVVLCFFTFGLWGSKEDARPICGNWGDCWSIRRFWGRVWHQMLRRVRIPCYLCIS